MGLDAEPGTLCEAASQCSRWSNRKDRNGLLGAGVGVGKNRYR